MGELIRIECPKNEAGLDLTADINTNGGSVDTLKKGEHDLLFPRGPVIVGEELLIRGGCIFAHHTLGQTLLELDLNMAMQET
jgi:hypothetical protein